MRAFRRLVLTSVCLCCWVFCYGGGGGGGWGGVGGWGGSDMVDRNRVAVAAAPLAATVVA